MSKILLLKNHVESKTGRLGPDLLFYKKSFCGKNKWSTT